MRLARHGESPVTALGQPFHISPPAISRHLRVLEKARLITRRRVGRVHVIRVQTPGLKSAQEWMTACATGWDFSFDTLDRLLEQQQTPHPENDSRTHVKPGPEEK
jgi:DNA-binding transcriptional ArsR family regulator